MHRRVAAGLEPGQGDAPFGGVRSGGPGDPPAELGAHEDALERRHGQEGTRNLEGAGEPQPADPVGGEMVDFPPLQEDLPGVGSELAAEQVEERGLAGAVRPDEAEYLPFPKRQIEAVHRREAAEALDDPARFHQGRSGGRPAHPTLLRISLTNWARRGAAPRGSSRMMKISRAPKAARWMSARLASTNCSRNR